MPKLRDIGQESIARRWLAVGLAGLMTWAAQGTAEDPPVADRPHADRHQRAIDAAERALQQDENAATQARAGDAYLRAGQPQRAVEHFNEAVRLRPSMEPYLWQRGIAFYFAKQYQAGQRQFERHRSVNPHDVENAAWHFVCVAKANSLPQARKILLPAPGDRRPPMKEILQYLHDGDAAPIEAAVEAYRESPAEYPSARFYADLYLGLVADAEGKPQRAIKFLRRAADTSMTHYMADVARAYVGYLEALSTKSEK